MGDVTASIKTIQSSAVRRVCHARIAQLEHRSGLILRNYGEQRNRSLNLRSMKVSAKSLSLYLQTELKPSNLARAAMGMLLRGPQSALKGRQQKGCELENGLPCDFLRRSWGIIDGAIHGPWWEMTFLPPRGSPLWVARDTASRYAAQKPD